MRHRLHDGDEKAADDLIGKAQSLDPSAPKQIVADMEEDAEARDQA